MSTRGTVTLRPALFSDAATIAALHAESWRRHYRGAYADRFLDGEVHANRHAYWSERLGSPGDHQTFVAECGGEAAGFAHVVLDADPVHGAMLDNLHVAHLWQGGGVGTLLLDRVARTVISCRPTSALFLWVLEPNVQAQEFYRARGGVFGDSVPTAPPAGDARNLVGTVMKIRVTWPDPRTLLPPDNRGGGTESRFA